MDKPVLPWSEPGPTKNRQHLIAVSLQRKAASACVRRIGIACRKETPDCRLFVGKIARNT